MKIEKRKISELIKAEYNPRKITKVQLQELKDGIDEFSLVLPLVVNENPERKNVIIGGHQRLKICEEMGYAEVDCSIVNLPLDKEKKLNIKLNKNGGSFDDELLQEHFEFEELIEWGFTPDELFDQDEKTDGLIDDDEIPEVKESKVKRGDIWQLGEHRVMCGDSTSSDDVAKLMKGEKADILITDPPYGIDLDTDYSKMGATTTKYEKIKGDSSEFDLKDVISISGTKEQYIWGGDYFVNSLDWMSGTQIIWAKRHSEKENKVFGSAFESLWVSYKCKKVIFFIRPINQSSERLGKHPTQKPIECMSRCIEMSKLTGNIYDAFLGSGSTLIAAEKLNRKCYGMELDEKYCDVIINRWEQFTGQKAEKTK
tara:strand:- start:740 stop:1849 length:1110 start_codon:yes stop_codon:yes gene_type:complete